MAKKNKTPTVQQTAARKVMDILKKNYALTPDTAIGYEAFKNVPFPTQVIAYTIANLMENGVVMRTDDERYYFVEENWNKMVKKVNFAYVGLIGIPVIAIIVVLAIQYLLN